MTAHVTIALEDDTKAKLETIAESRQETVESMVSDAVRDLIEYDTWFRAAVEKGLASVDADLTIPHEEVVARARRRHQERLALKT